MGRLGRGLGLAVGVALLALGCAPANPAAGGGNSPSLLSQRPKGQWLNTQVQIQRFKSLLFRNKSDGAILNPQSAASLPPDQVVLETGEWDELHYEAGRLRYTGHPREREAQPTVIDRAFSEAEFEAVDVALWTDPFFNSEQKNWDATTRLPMFYVRYNQSGKGHEASFTPSLAKLSRTSRLVEPYFRQLSGEAIPPAGVAHVLYGLSLAQGRCEVRLAQLKAAGNEADEASLPLNGVKVDTGSGLADATLTDKGFSFTAPTTKGEVAVAVELTPKEGAAWKTLLSVRVP